MSAIVAFAAVVVASLASVDEDLRRLTVHGSLLLVGLFSAWYALTRDGGRRVIGILVALAAVATLIALLLAEDSTHRGRALLRLGLVIVAVALARFALGRDVRSAKRAATTGRPVGPARKGVLLINLKSGGGKAKRWHLADESRRRGIQPVVLGAGDDLRRLAIEAIEDGADVIGMAGGDGSQAVVATVARERGVPMVVVPAGTRNHLARDLGLDRDSLLEALDAFGDAVERPLDLAEVNGRVFVNNVSLGLYASIVASPEYRDAKVETTLAALPAVLRPGTPSFPLSYAGPTGEHRHSAHLIQISNNPYRRSLQGLGSRPRLDSGRLGIVTVEVESNRAASALITAAMAGRPDRFSGFSTWTAESFQVASSSPIEVGLDGESMVMEPPLDFAIRKHAVRVRLPRAAIGSSPAARALDWRTAPRDLWRVAAGRPLETER